jgi:hypothetical protein
MLKLNIIQVAAGAVASVGFKGIHRQVFLYVLPTPTYSNWPSKHDQLVLNQGSSCPFAFLSAPGASSGQTSVHAVEEPWLPLQNLSAGAPGAAEPQCALTGGKSLVLTPPLLLVATHPPAGAPDDGIMRFQTITQAQAQVPLVTSMQP